MPCTHMQCEVSYIEIQPPEHPILFSPTLSSADCSSSARHHPPSLSITDLAPSVLPSLYSFSLSAVVSSWSRTVPVVHF